jgi:enhancing lycopene biosynthesis protein 2
VLVESARIARSAPRPLSELSPDQADGVVWPGGFGAAKNLSTFALEGAAMTVDPEAERVIQQFHEAGKPQALCCIAPVVAAKVPPAGGPSPVRRCSAPGGSPSPWGGGGQSRTGPTRGPSMSPR